MSGINYEDMFNKVDVEKTIKLLDQWILKYVSKKR